VPATHLPKLAWVFDGLYPWFPQEGSQVGPGTNFPVETGWVPSADLYWSPKLLVMNVAGAFVGGGSVTNTEAGFPRCDRAIQLLLKKPAEVHFNKGDFFSESGDFIDATYTLSPESRFVENRHFLKQICSGFFERGSSRDHFSSFAPGALESEFVGYCEVVANSGVQSVFLIPLYRSGPNELIQELQIQITRQAWTSEEL
jgi:hypothetical protein